MLLELELEELLELDEFLLVIEVGVGLIWCSVV